MPTACSGSQCQSGNNVEERQFYSESQDKKPATLNCPYCRTQDTYELNWVVRKKKDRLPAERR